MANHYIRILQTNEDVYRKMTGTAQNWREDLFQDLTNGGKFIKTVDMELSQGRPAIMVCGKKYFGLVGIDKFRDDTLVLFAIGPDQNRRTDEFPVKVPVGLLPLEQGERPAEDRDPVEYLFDKIIESSRRTDEERVKEVTVTGTPTSKLKDILGYATEERRSKWLPEAAEGGSIDCAGLLDAMKSAWRLLDLRKYTHPSTRQAGVLNGTVPVVPKDDEILEFRQLFNINMLNAAAENGTASQELVFRIADSLAGLNLPEVVRSRVWGAMAQRLDPNKFRRELKDIAHGLNELGPDDADAWAPVIIDTARSIGNHFKDGLLLQMAERAEADDDPKNFFHEWAGKVKFKRSGDAKAPGPCEGAGGKRRGQGPGAGSGPDAASDPAGSSPGEAGPGAGAYASKSAGPRKAGNGGRECLPGAGPGARGKVESWIIRHRIPSLQKYLETLPKQVDEARARLKAAIVGAATIDGLENLVAELNGFCGLLRENAGRVPGIDLLNSDLSEGMKVFEQHQRSLGDAIHTLMDMGIPPQDLREIGQILSDASLIDALPQWLWTVQEKYDPEAYTDEPFPVLLANPIVRNRIRSALAIVAKSDPPLVGLLNDAEPPARGETIDEFFRKTSENFSKLKETITALGKQHRGWANAAFREGVHREQIIETAARIDGLGARIDDETFAPLMAGFEKIEGQKDRETLVLLYESAIEHIEEAFGSARNMPYQKLADWVSRNRARVLSAQSDFASQKIELELAHQQVDHPHRVVRLAYTAYPRSRSGNHGFVSAPVYFRCNFRPADLNLSLQYAVKCSDNSLTSAWPQEWNRPGPDEIQIRATQWRKFKDAFRHEFKVTIPLRPPREKFTKLHLEVTAIERETGEKIPVKGSLTWSEIDLESREVSLEWPDGIQVKYVNEHPIGPQEHLKYIQSRITGGSSFATVAPRRFGKTTLALYLQENGHQMKMAVPQPILCTQMTEGSPTVNPKRLWKTVSDRLYDLLEVPLKYDGGAMPPKDGFDMVRREASRRGYEGILLIFDEAQLLFPRATGPTLGTELKDLLETEWSRKDRRDMAPVFFGLIGLPDMLTKVGVNLQGLLKPQDIRSLSETRLNSLIYKFTRENLHTTREARELLCRKSGNLFMLKTILSKLIAYVNKDYRNWIFHDDVVEVVEELKKGLRENRELEVAGYLRDVLNESENVDIWQPLPCYPMAVALARASEDAEENHPYVVQRAVETLNDWCRNSGFDETKSLIYTEKESAKHLQKLRESGIYSESQGFESGILKAWLVGLSRSFPGSEKDRESLFAGAMERIKMPEGRELVKSGAQADVYMFSEKEQIYALRAVHLSGHEDRKRFHETVEILKQLQKLSLLREEGARYVYNLRNIGLAESSEGADSDGIVGVEIYQWIDGTSLEEKCGKLPAPLTADIGRKLSKALRLIHSRDIIHRDVCPRNIIIEGRTANPVLVDFGLARYSHRIAHTVIEGEYAAPEIVGKKPVWGTAADVYSLGRTLQALISPGNNNFVGLKSILEAMVSENPSARPTADELVGEFTGIIPDLHLNEKQEAAWQRLLKTAAPDLEKEWFKETIGKVKPAFITTAMGLHDSIFDRCTEAAQLLDFTLEGYPGDEPLKLSYAFHRHTEATGNILKDRECIAFLFHLRISRNHIDPKKSSSKIMKKFGNPSDTQMHQWTEEGARLVAQALRVDTLPEVVALFFE